MRRASVCPCSTYRAHRGGSNAAYERDGDRGIVGSVRKGDVVCYSNAVAPFRDEKELEDALSRPSPAVEAALGDSQVDLIVLGAGRKMGLSVARMARRAMKNTDRRVIAVSRFSDASTERAFREAGVETIACDLANPEAVRLLPTGGHVIFMAGRKFGTLGDEALTWAANTVVPVRVADHFAGSRIVVYSTGCVYPLVNVTSGGSREEDDPAPVGEYAQSALGRERVFEYFSRERGTEVCMFRLNYAVDMRYGVIHDIATRIARGEAVDVTMGYVNVIWQGDAAAYSLSALGRCSSPPSVLNVTGPEILSVRRIAEDIGGILGKPVLFTGSPAAVAYLSDASRAFAAYGYPRIGARRLVELTADWVRGGGRSLNKPTHFEEQGGRY